MTPRHGCYGCSNTWSGLARAHCSACHETFDKLDLFDLHRKNSRCLKPKTFGMVWADGIWSVP